MSTTALLDTVPAAANRYYSALLSPWALNAVDATNDGNYVARATLAQGAEFLSDNEWVWVETGACTAGNGGVRCQGVHRDDGSGGDSSQNFMWLRLSTNSSNVLGFFINRSGTVYSAYIDGTDADNRMHGQWRIAVVKRIKPAGGGDHQIQTYAINGLTGALVKSGWTDIPSANADLDDLHNAAAGGEFRVSSYNAKSAGTYGTANPVMQSTPIIARLSGTGTNTVADQGLDDDDNIREILLAPGRALAQYAGAFDRVYNWRACDDSNDPLANKAAVVLTDDHTIRDQSGQDFHLTLDVTDTVYAMPEFSPACHFPGFQISVPTAGSPRSVPIESGGEVVGYNAAFLTHAANQDRLGLHVQTFDADGAAVGVAVAQLGLVRKRNEGYTGLEDMAYHELSSFATDSHKGCGLLKIDDGAGDEAYIVWLANHSQHAETVGADTVFAQQAFAVVTDANLCPNPTFADEMAGDAAVGVLTYSGNEAQYAVGCCSYPRGLSLGDRAVFGARSELTGDGAFIAFMYDHGTTTWRSKVITANASGDNNAGITGPPIALDNGRVLFTASVREDGATNYEAAMGLIGDCTNLTTFDTDARWTAWDGDAITVGTTQASADVLNMWTENVGESDADKDDCRILDVTRCGDTIVMLYSYAPTQADNRPYSGADAVPIARRYAIDGNALVDTDADGAGLSLLTLFESLTGIDAEDFEYNTLGASMVAVSDTAVVIAVPDKATAVSGSSSGETFTERNTWGATLGFIGVQSIDSTPVAYDLETTMSPDSGCVAIAPSNSYQGVGDYPTMMFALVGWYDNSDANEEASVTFATPMAMPLVPPGEIAPVGPPPEGAFTRDGTFVPYTALSDLSVAEMVGIGASSGDKLVGVAHSGGAAGEVTTLCTEGAWRLPKATGVSWGAGTLLYADLSAQKLTTVSTSNEAIGRALDARANEDTMGLVKLGQK